MTHLDYSYTATEAGFKRAKSRIYERLGKRFFDVATAILLLPLVFPLVLLLAAINFLCSGGAFFGHRRVGRSGRSFICWKLQTMRPNADAYLKEYLATNAGAAQEWQQKQKLTNDPRVTRFGRFLRRTSLDELPQLLNVLRGDMSLVGPRPIIQEELSHYGSAKQKYLSVRPGITGLWQIYGRSNGCYIERVSLDRIYCNSISMRNDIRLLLRTVFVVFWPTGR